MTGRLWLFVESSVEEGSNRDDILAALCDGEVLGKILPKWETEEELAVQTAEVDEAYAEVSKWPERFTFRYRIGYRDGEYEGEEDIVASSQDEAEDLVLEKHTRAKLVWHECLGLANGTLEEVLYKEGMVE